MGATYDMYFVEAISGSFSILCQRVVERKQSKVTTQFVENSKWLVTKHLQFPHPQEQGAPLSGYIGIWYWLVMSCCMFC